MRAERRAWSFEKRLAEERGSELARCWEEMREKVQRRRRDVGLGLGEKKLF